MKRVVLARPEKVCSGGQTGVDRAALDFAIKYGIEHGGWVPPGRTAEDGALSDQYEMQELGDEDFFEHGYDSCDPRDGYRLRTRFNLKDADGTLIVTPDRQGMSPGTQLTIRLARELGAKMLLVDPEDEDGPWRVEMWVADNEIKTLNVAGPRESRKPGIYDATFRLLEKAFHFPEKKE
jgi:hypothetical protein